MSNTTAIAFVPGLGEGRIQHLVARLSAAVGAARLRWMQASRVRAQNAAVRGLDRRTRQDLGLYADDDPWPSSGSLAAEIERMRW